MTTNITKNYIITALLVIKNILQIKENYITTSEYMAFKKTLMEKFSEKNIDALIVDDYLDENYFHYAIGHDYIVLNEPDNLVLDKAKSRYQGYLPIEIILFLYGEESINIAYQVIKEEKMARINNIKRELNQIVNNYENYVVLQRTKK